MSDEEGGKSNIVKRCVAALGMGITNHTKRATRILTTYFLKNDSRRITKPGRSVEDFATMARLETVVVFGIPERATKTVGAILTERSADYCSQIFPFRNIVGFDVQNIVDANSN